MEPVLQRFGDVTIQRLEKPKETKDEGKKDSSKSDGTSSSSHEDEDSGDEFLDGPNGLKRNLPSSKLALKRFKYDPSGISLEKKCDNSESEVSEYDSESGDESDPEDFNNIEKNSKTSSFYDPAFKPPTNAPIKLEPPQEQDYDYDIKEKLKEMGEISFETVKKGDKPKKPDAPPAENEVVVTPAKKGAAPEEDATGERKGPNMRRNIREVMDETKLDESTLAAQRLEAERLRRVQEQQRLLREIQRQSAQERMQNKVLNLLQGNNLSKPGTSATTQTRIGNTVLVKLPNGQTKPMTRLPKRPFDLVRVQKSPLSPQPPQIVPTSPTSPPLRLNNVTIKKPSANLTPSVSIAPVTKKPILNELPAPISDESDSETEEKPHMAVPSEPVVPTIDISSDDDCIVVSEPESEGPDEPDDDPSNSGMHTNDEFNQPDEQGRVLVNVGHPDDEGDVFVAPQISGVIKPHQIGGVRFLYDNVIESTTRFESSTGFGCILAHSMGLGKTLQLICFIDIFLRYTPAKTILCIMPINTLQNWMAEFNMWLPTGEASPNSPLNANGEVRPRNFNLHVLNDSHKTLTARAKVIRAWQSGGGVLLIGYEQFRLLSLRKHPKSRRKPNAMSAVADDDSNKLLFDDIQCALVKPGPDLVICDEGHRIKNSHASISQALKQMRTKRRVVLTGYPLQNNLMEYWCMVDFVRPNYLGSKTEFCNMFERPIMNGQCIDSTEADIKLMRYRAHVLHSLLVGFVQRRSHTVLQSVLPQKEEYVLLVRMSEFQRTLYETFMNEVVRIQAVPNPLKAFAVCCKIWNHPDVLYTFLKKRAGGEAVDIDLEEVASTAATNEKEKAKKAPAKPKRAATTKGKNGKPAASITPYNSSADSGVSCPTPASAVETPASTTFPTQNTNAFAENGGQNFQTPSNYYEQFDQNAQFPSSFPNTQSQNFMNNEQNQNFANLTGSFNQNTQQTNSFVDVKGFNNFNNLQSNTTSQQSFYNQQYNTNQYNTQQQQTFNNYDQNYQNYQQNSQQQQQSYWQSNNFNQNNYFQQQQQQHFNNPNSSWIKQEDCKPITDSIISPVKSESSNDSKPKINIISDIKLPPVFNSNSNSEKKINIISDIKIEPKLETPDEKYDVNSVKQETKTEIKTENEVSKNVTKASDSKLLPIASLKDSREDGGIPYDWAVELLKDYIPGCIENSAKMEILFCIIRESIALGDRLLVFSQSLITLDLIEQFLQSSLVPGDTVNWARNTSYYRLDGSTSALEREKLINEFNSNPKIYLFLVSTRAGSLGINLIGANRVVVLDASWNPCHDTQAVCRVYRYGQRKPCFVYRLVVDNCLEKKIYDRQISKQGISDRVVDECNPDAHLTIKDVNTLCWDDKSDEGEEKDWAHVKDNYIDVVLQKVLNSHGRRLNKEPFQHESLLVDRKEKQLSQQEKRLAKKGYEREKQAARQPSYNVMGGLRGHRPIASVRPMQQHDRPSRWIPAEHWQRQGMTAQEMTLPLDVVIPTNQPEKGNIVLKAGQKVLVLKSPKGVYMQLESGKIVAIKTAIKVKGKPEDNDPMKMGKPNQPPPPVMPPVLPPTMKVNPSMAQMPPKRVVKPFQPNIGKFNVRNVRHGGQNIVTRIQSITPPTKKLQMAKTKPYQVGGNNDLMTKDEPIPGSSSSDDEHNLNNTDNVQKRISMLNKQISIQRVTNQSNLRQQKGMNKMGESSALEQLEQTTSSVLNDNTPFQDTLDSITNSYKEDAMMEHLEQDDSLNRPSKNHSIEHHSEASDQSDDITYVSEQPPTQSQQQQQHGYGNQPAALEHQPKVENPQEYNQYYNYNYGVAQYQAPPPQPYTYPGQHPPYDMMSYGAPPPPPPPPQQAQYNYNYQAYPPQPHYAPGPPHPPPMQPSYDYSNQPPPAQPIYTNYNPYPQYAAVPQQVYGAPPPPAAAPTPTQPYSEYQYNQTAAPPQPTFYPNT